MYEPREEEPTGCRDTWVLTRAAFAILIWPLLALAGVMAAVFVAILLFAVHPALALLPLAALLGGALLFVRREQGRFRPPEG